MRVIVAEHVPDGPRGFLVRLVVEIPLLPHAVEGAAVDRLQAVAHVGESAADDDRHRVVEVGPADFLLDRDRDAFFGG